MKLLSGGGSGVELIIHLLLGQNAGSGSCPEMYVDSKGLRLLPSNARTTQRWMVNHIKPRCAIEEVGNIMSMIPNPTERSSSVMFTVFVLSCIFNRVYPSLLPFVLQMLQHSTQKMMETGFKNGSGANLRSKRSIVGQRYSMVGNRGTAFAGRSPREKEDRTLIGGHTRKPVLIEWVRSNAPWSFP